MIFVNSADLEKLFIDFYEVLPAIDLLITDYSSIYFDWLLTDKPVVFFIPDVMSYSETRDFLLDPLEIWMPGPICTNIDHLIDAMKRTFQDERFYLKERLSIKDTVHFFKDGASCSRVIDLIDQVIEGSFKVPKTKLLLSDEIFKPAANITFDCLKNLITQGKYMEVKELFEKDYVPTEYYHFLALAISLANLGMKVEALEYGKKAADLNPKDPEALLNLAELYYMNDQLLQASDTALKALDKAGNDPFMFDILATFYAMMGEVRLKERFAELALESVLDDNLKKDISKKHGVREMRRRVVLIFGELLNGEVFYDLVEKGFDVIVADQYPKDNAELRFIRSLGVKIVPFDETMKINTDDLVAIICFGNIPSGNHRKPHSVARIMKYFHEFEKAIQFFKNKNPRLSAIFAFNCLETVLEDVQMNELFYKKICSADYMVFPTRTFWEYFKSKFPSQDQARSRVMLVDTFSSKFVTRNFSENPSKMVLYFPYLSSSEPIPQPKLRKVNLEIEKLRCHSLSARSALLNQFHDFAQNIAFGLGPFFRFNLGSDTSRIEKAMTYKFQDNTTEIYCRTNVFQEILLYLTAGIIPIVLDNGNDFHRELYKRGMAFLLNENFEYFEPDAIGDNIILKMKRNIMTNTELYTTEKFLSFLEEVIQK